MSVRFYNPGSRIFEKMAFDHPSKDIKSVNLIAYYQIDAPEKDFFEVPTEVEVHADSGPVNVSVKFADRIQKDFKDYGVVRIDPKRDVEKKPIADDENVALTNKEAKERGERLWKDYLLAMAREHISNVDMARAAGGVPMRAKGIYAQALKHCGIEDPADQVGTAVSKKQDSEEMSDLKAQIAELRAALITKGK